MTDLPKRRWFRFSLRTLLILVVVLAIPLGWIAKERRQSHHEKQIAEQLRELGASNVELGGPYDSMDKRLLDQPQGWYRAFSRQVLGERIIWLALPPDSTNLRPLFGLTNLQLLDAGTTKVSDLKLLAELDELRSINFDNTNVSDLSPLSGLRHLKSIRLHSTQVRDLSPLTGLTDLNELQVINSKVSDIRPLAGLRNLAALSLGHTEVNEVASLVELKKLWLLDLSDTKVRDISPLAELTDLKYLRLGGTEVREVSLLAALTQLTQIDLTNSKVSEEQVYLLQKALPNCKIKHSIGWPLQVDHDGTIYRKTGKGSLRAATNMPCAEYATASGQRIWLLADGTIEEE